MTRIAIMSPRGGAGVTTVTANLGLALAEDGLDVACVDLDDQAALRLYLGLVDPEDRPPGARSPDLPENLRLIESDGRGDGWRDGTADGTGQARVVLIDTPRSRPDLRDAVLEASDAWLCVLPADPAAVAMAPRVQDLLTSGQRAFVLINHVDPRFALRRHAGLFLADVFANRLIGSIRKDEAVNEAQANLERLPVFAPHSSAWADFKRLAQAGRDVAAGRRPTSGADL
ncbi:ParA family protein [Brevundimonas naejangsanensis]|uniref:ParA family protein n=1 Tax=Brevundimonas naejangsanensis TaxID=588932 RepID=UPI0026EFDB37|nr:cellulose synthase operon protein YhjQ/BcsQ [Brevundimonas naejangsanensis]